ncbi:MAG: transporter substrate-binding domain-containing protein [Candidatus Cloacimonetes bacterium]|nr:transporter substrate-binding domain-containing protein [Candidatus Cloacimonadota bacterium]
MKKFTILCVILLFIGTLVTKLNADVSKEMDKLKIYTEEFVPLNFMQDGEITGQSTEVVKALLDRLGIDKNITLLQWSDAYQKLMNEANIALYSTCLTAERKDLFKWVGPISSVEIYFYTSKDHMVDITTLEEAKKIKKIGVLKDYAITSILKEKGFKNLVEFRTAKDVITKLISGEVDLFPCSNLVLNSQLNKLNIQSDKIKKALFITSELEYIAFSKSTSDALIQTWQKELDAMKNDGYFDEIFKKWLPDEIPPGIMQIYTEDYPPLSFEKDGVITGFGTDVVREIISRLDIPDNIRISSWENGYHLCLVNPNVVLYTMKRTKLREDLFNWIGPIGSNRTMFYAKKGSNIKIGSIDDAKKIGKIATCSAWFSEQDLKDKGFTNLVSSPDPKENVRQLVEGEVDLSIFTDITIPDIAQQAGYSINDLVPVFTVSSGEFYIALSKGTPKYVVDEWQQVFLEMYDDGTLEEMYKKWLPKSKLPEINK